MNDKSEISFDGTRISYTFAIRNKFQKFRNAIQIDRKKNHEHYSLPKYLKRNHILKMIRTTTIFTITAKKNYIFSM